MKNSAVLCLLCTIILFSGAAQARFVACVGDSITFGDGIADRSRNSYPAQLGAMLQQFDARWEVENFGVNGATALFRGDLPYVQQGAFQSARNAEPDVVVIMLGTNDTKAFNWVYRGDFVSNCRQLIDVFAGLPSAPEIWLCKPVPAFSGNFGIQNSVLQGEVLPFIDQIARETGLPVIDLYTTLEGMGHLFADGIHPNAEGAGIIATTIAAAITGVRRVPDFDNDGVVNLHDFALLAQHDGADALRYDLSPAPEGDDLVDARDVAGLSRHWLSTPGLIAHWRLDEDEGLIAHESVLGHDGTLRGDAIWSPSDGMMGGALLLDGLSGYVSTEMILDPGDGPFTVLIWIRGGKPGGTLLSQMGTGRNAHAWMGTDPLEGTLLTDLTDGARGTKTLFSKSVITDREWHGVQLVWDGSYRHLALDGHFVAADTSPLNPLDPSRMGLHLGAGGTLDPAEYWMGSIDDVRIYQKALSLDP